MNNLGYAASNIDCLRIYDCLDHGGLRGRMVVAWRQD